MIRQTVRRFINRWPYLKALRFIVDDLAWGVRVKAGLLDTDSGATHAMLSVEESLRYIEDVFADYKRYGGVTTFHGRAAELGPGDNFGVALLLRREGCSQVDLIDRYWSRRDPDKQDRIYEALSHKYQLDWLKLGRTWNVSELAGISLTVGLPAEVYIRDRAQRQPGTYDFIVSRAVLEHLYDPLGVVEAMVCCLAPGGRMIHKIDLRDHGMFPAPHHELTFLRFPRLVYKSMTQNSGRPNRILLHRYREVLERLKQAVSLDYSIVVTRLVGVGDLIPHQRYESIERDMWNRATGSVEQYRRRLATEFQNVDSRDLAVAGCFLVVTKL